MTILIAYSSSAEGRAALEQGRDIATRLACSVLVFDLEREGGTSSRDLQPPPETSAPDGERWLGAAPSAPMPVDDLLDTARELGVEAIVVGVRRRSPVGKLILGSQAQRIILDAAVPVVAVKVAGADQ